MEERANSDPRQQIASLRLQDQRTKKGLAERMLAVSRLDASDKPIFAANLGILAERVNSKNPLDGARQIVNRARNEGVWAKRKRYFRLPGEDAPPAEKDAGYASSPSTFVRLAKAAAEILCPGANPELIDVEKSRAIKTLASGSSFMPIWLPSRSGDVNAKGLLDEFAAAISRRIAQETRLIELWEILRDTPIDVEYFTDKELKKVEPDQYGETSKFPPELIPSLFPSEIIGARFKPSNDPYQLKWSCPRIEIGRLSLSVEVPALIIPEEQRRLFGDKGGILAKEAVDWLGEVGACVLHSSSDSDFIDYYEFPEEFDWASAKLVVTTNVSLEVDEGKGLRPKIVLSPDDPARSGSWLISHLDTQCLLDHQDIMNCVKYNLSNLDMYIDLALPSGPCLSDMAIVYADPAAFREPNRAPALAVLPDHFHNFYSDALDTLDTCAWTDDPGTASILLGEQGVFNPILADTEPVAGPLRRGSVGAALLNNVLQAADGNKIADLLVERCRLTADAGLRFHEAMMESYRGAIRKI